MTKKNIQCNLAGLGRTTALRAQGRHGFDSVTGSGRHGLREDDDAVDPGTARLIDVTVWGMRPVSLTAAPTRVREDGST
jgi:hypothetical protein